MYILVFIMGTIFGSFLTLAVYRLPLHKDITHERSFCPNCNHKLGFLDLIPVWSYIFLKGKCRYCGEKIRIRYLFLEVLSGLVFLISYISMNFNFPFFELDKMVYFVMLIIFYVTIALISGIDKEYRTINKPVIVFGTIIQIFYILYLCIVKNAIIYRYSIYLGFLILVMLFDKLLKQKEKKSNYIIEIIIYTLYINLFVDADLFLLIVLITILFSIWGNVIRKVKQNANLQSIDSKKVVQTKLSIGYYLGVATIIILIIQNFSYYWRS